MTSAALLIVSSITSVYLCVVAINKSPTGSIVMSIPVPLYASLVMSKSILR